MIAPIREAEPPPRAKGRSHEIRRIVASLFLDDEGTQANRIPPPARWKAWLVVGWAITITALYFVSMLNLL